LTFGSFGFASFIFGYVSSALVNKEDVQPDIPHDGSGDKDKLYPKNVAERVPHMLRICLICWFCFCVIAISFVSRNPKFKQNEKRVKIIND